MGSDSTAKANAPATPTGWYLKPAHAINLHKLIITPVVLGLMWYYSCYTSAAWTYLALHGIYGVLWIVKDLIFPDKNFVPPCSFGLALFIFVMLNVAYLSTPWVLVVHAKSVPAWYQAIVIALFSTGMFLMMGADCQKYYLLQAAPGKLITNGFFKYIRSPNYLGEILIYCAYSMLTYTAWGWLSTLWFVVTGVVPNMAKKDSSMSRYPEFAAYKARTYRVLPPFY